MRIKLLGIVAYLATIHLALGLVIYKSDIIDRVQDRLGYGNDRDEWGTATIERMFTTPRRSIPNGSIVMLGDSIVASINPKTITPQTINLAVGGDTVRRVSARIGMFDELHQARLVIIGVGNNDLDHRDPPQIAREYRRILAALRQPVVMLSVLPIDTKAEAVKVHPKITMARISALNELLRDVCQEHEHCHYVDTWPTMVCPTTGELCSTNTVDGVHLSDNGQHRLAALIAQATLQRSGPNH